MVTAIATTFDVQHSSARPHVPGGGSILNRRMTRVANFRVIWNGHCTTFQTGEQMLTEGLPWSRQR